MRLRSGNILSSNDESGITVTVSSDENIELELEVEQIVEIQSIVKRRKPDYVPVKIHEPQIDFLPADTVSDTGNYQVDCKLKKWNYIQDENIEIILKRKSIYPTVKPHNKYILYSLQISSALVICMYLVLPTTVRLFPSIISEVVFLHRVRWPPFVNLSKPADVGLNYTWAFNLVTEPGIEIGAWHTLPSDFWASEPDEGDYVKLLNEGHPIILYLHGNAGTRGGWHRVQLYKVLAKAGFHVISIDYRGFGDSSGSPTEEGVCHDGLLMYLWILKHCGTSSVYIWGHSMGSGVATKIASQVCDKGLPLSALFLETPFNNMLEAATKHPFSQPFRFLPWFAWAFVEALKTNNIIFSSDTSISRVTAPTLILHAKDDGIVPYDLGLKLYNMAKTTKMTGGVEMATFDAHHGYGHKHIHKAPELPAIIREFIKKYHAH